MKKIICLSVLLFLAALCPLWAEVIVIDAGHGGYDYGIKTPVLKEKALALAIAKELESILRKEHKKVFLTRSVDSYLSIGERAFYAHRYMPDIFLSLHATNLKGFSVYTSWYPETTLTAKERYLVQSRQKPYIENSIALSRAIGGSLKGEFRTKVSLCQMPIPILNAVSSASVLIEVPLSADINYTEAVARIADAIFKGISIYENP